MFMLSRLFLKLTSKQQSSRAKAKIDRLMDFDLEDKARTGNKKYNYIETITPNDFIG